MNIPIVPKPQVIKQAEERFVIHDNLKIVITGSDKEKLLISAGEIKNTLSEFLEIGTSIAYSENDGDIFLSQTKEFKTDAPIPNDKIQEAYTLKIKDNRIEINAVSAKGIYYGTMSLVQLLEKAENKTLPMVEITDWPDLSVRGISDDISRGQVSTIENFKRIIKFISRYKLNTYMPYLEDMLQFESYPSIGEGRGALSKEEVKEIVEYADEHFVEVVPIFQTLGHYENILNKPEFLKYAEFPGAASLNVSNEETYEFLETLLKEVFEMFPSGYFHMGADESWDVGLGKSKHLVEQSSLADVHAEHYQKVYDICKKFGKKVLMYGDIILNHPEILDKLPKDIIIVDWHYGAHYNYPSTITFNEAGYQYYVSPSVWNFLTTFPANLHAIPNIQYMIKDAIENGASGMINSNWGDYGAETFKELILFGYAWSAQCSWNYNASDESEFSNNFFYDFFGIDDDRSTEIYKTLSMPMNNVQWHYIWRHPLLPFPPPVWWEGSLSPAVRISWIDWTISNLKSDLNDLEDKVKKNNNHFALLRFAADMLEYYKFKLQTQYLLNDKMNGKEIDLNKAYEFIDKNISKLNRLKSDFKTIWLKYYKEANLILVEDKFNRLIAYFDETKVALKTDNLKSPLTDSKWIYHPGTGIQDSLVRKASFKKSFNLNDEVESAYLQLLGNTYAKLYINGEFVGEVYARRSLSLAVDYKRILFLDVNEFLKPGENIIDVVVENYNEKGKAGFNLVAQIKTSEDELMLMSDESWQVTETNLNEWMNAVPGDYPWLITAPNFETKRTSWIERQ